MLLRESRVSYLYFLFFHLNFVDDAEYMLFLSEWMNYENIFLTFLLLRRRSSLFKKRKLNYRQQTVYSFTMKFIAILFRYRQIVDTSSVADIRNFSSNKNDKFLSNLLRRRRTICLISRYVAKILIDNFCGTTTQWNSNS